MRLFIAINFSNDTRNKLIAIRDELSKMAKQRGKFTLPENIHLTLAFIGECNAKQVNAAKISMEKVSFSPFDLKIDRIRHYSRSSGDIWWAGVSRSIELFELQRNLTTALTENGLDCDKRKYNPHITLGREFNTIIYYPWQIEPFSETVTKIELMKSERISGKLTYTAIYSKEAEL